MTDQGRYGAAGRFLLLLLLAAAAAGCSTVQENGNLVDAQGNHPANFVSIHPNYAGSSGALCMPCHGDDLRGGIAKVSCFNAACHHDPIPNWATPGVHGAEAKKAPGSSGFASCRICHGSGFAGGGAGVACSDCHGGSAPHPVNWLSTDTYKHNTTDLANAPVCALCHFNEPAAGHHPPVDPPSGSTPGCFNNTLCHGPKVPLGSHTTGWLNSDAGAAFHGRSGLTCGECHPIPGHPTCTTCHFDAAGSRANASLAFAHDVNVFTNHRRGALVAVGNVCENCHQTSRRYRGGVPSGCGPTQDHPFNEGCHYDDALLNPVLGNPRF